MKQFTLLIEQVQSLLLEANFKPLHKVWQQQHFLTHGRRSYKEMTPEQKKFYEEDIKQYEKELQTAFDEYGIEDDSTQNWIINVFVTGQQDCFTDQEKVCEQIRYFNRLKLHDKLTKKEKDLSKYSYNDFYEFIKKYEEENPALAEYGNNQIVHEDGIWKTVKLIKYDDAEPLINRTNWCIKYRKYFSHYGAPYYAFFKNDKPYALFHKVTYQLKNEDDLAFQTIDDDFNEQVKWLFKHNYEPKDFHILASDLLPLLKKDIKYCDYFERDGLLTVMVKSGYIDLAINYINTYPDANVNEMIKGGYSQPILQYLIGRNYDTLFKVLLAHPKIDVNAVNSDNQSCLQVAYLQENMDCFKLLIEHPKIDVNYNDPSYHCSLLVKLAGAKYTYKPIQYKAIELLLRHPKIDVNSIDKEGKTALHYAIDLGSRKMVTSLLAHPKIDVNIKNNDGLVPLQVAVRNKPKDYDIIEQLLKHPKMKHNMTDPNKKSVLYYAKKENDPYLIELVSKYGVENKD